MSNVDTDMRHGWPIEEVLGVKPTGIVNEKSSSKNGNLAIRNPKRPQTRL